MSDYRLMAIVQPQVWVRNNAQDAGEAIVFDAHDAMLSLDAKEFAHAAGQILGFGHDYDELAIRSGVIDQWLSGGENNTFVVTVEDSDFEDWLGSMEVTADEAKKADEAFMQSLRERAAAVPSP